MSQKSETPKEYVFGVIVSDGAGSKTYEAAVNKGYVAKLTDKSSASDLVKSSFEFLLDNESKESILTRFDLSEIELYFPDYPEKIQSYLP